MRLPTVLLSLSLSIAVLSSSARAQEREYCPDRPGIADPACTMAPGRTSLEIGVGSWSLDRDADQREDSFVVGDMVLRHGIAEHAEVQVGWTSLGLVRTRDRATGAIDHASGTGDVTLALRRNLANPDGSGFSVAVQPFVTLPVGGKAIGDRSWSAGLRVPLSYALSDKLSLDATTEIDAAANADGGGRHFVFDQVIGASWALNKTITATAEYQVVFDHDPVEHAVEHVAGVSAGWMAAPNLQLDLGANVGLDADATDAEVYFGVSRRF